LGGWRTKLPLGSITNVDAAGKHEAVAFRDPAARLKDHGELELRDLWSRYRYRDSNPGFRTENWLWELDYGRFVTAQPKEFG
jgi:hypothetical protein